MKRCTKCREMKAKFLFAIQRKNDDGVSLICKRCENRRQKEARAAAKDWKYPYTGLNDPNYIKDKAKCFAIQAKRTRKEMGLNW